MAKVQLWGYRCERCGHEWLPRDRETAVEPKVCPTCKNPYWNVPRRVAKPAAAAVGAAQAAVGG